jgi:hypothetical protein
MLRWSLVALAFASCARPRVEEPTPVPMPAVPPVDAGAADVIVERKPLLTGNEPTRAQLQASTALEKFYPDIDAVARDLGAPFARGMGPRTASQLERQRPATNSSNFRVHARHVYDYAPLILARTLTGPLAVGRHGIPRERQRCDQTGRNSPRSRASIRVRLSSMRFQCSS